MKITQQPEDQRNRRLPEAESRLWAAVMLCAIKDLTIRGERRKAIAWIRSTRGIGDIGSYQFICNLFDIDPNGLKRLLQEQEAPK